jgi:glycosyltransferase involved in cell wall biosynthesis
MEGNKGAIDVLDGPLRQWPASEPRGKLSFVITSLMHGGAETQICELATRLALRGWDTEVVVLRRPEAFVDDLESRGIPVLSMTGPGTIPVLGEFLALRRYLRSAEPLVVHSHMYRANVFSRLSRIGRPTQSALICTAHNTNEGPTAGVLKGSTEVVYRLTDKYCDLTTNVSQAAVDRYVGTRATPSDRIRFVRNGIDTSKFRPDAAIRNRVRASLGLNNEICILAVGRLERQKNTELMIRAFAAAREGCPDSVLLLVGAGSLEPMLRRLTAELKVEEHVRFLGLRDDVDDLMRAADVYANSSLYEGLPIVLLEAAASGVPIVATDVGGTPEIVLNGNTGTLVPSENLGRFSDALRSLMSVPECERREIGERSREFIEATYGIENIVDQWEQLYWNVLERKRAGG